MDLTNVSKDKIDVVLKNIVHKDGTFRELLVLVLQLSNYRVDTKEYIRLMSVYSDQRFMREIKKIVKP